MSTPPPERPQTTEPPAAPAAAGSAPPSSAADGRTVAQATPSRAALAPDPTLVQIPGYEILGELGRGGMGAVLKGRDPDLGRELAVKVLLERHHDDPRTVVRFLEEAQVGGQLQHPGVVPVYTMGRLADGRPYFTMKLIEGRTLAALLKERESPVHDLSRFLPIFQQICQTLAYAHSKGVIHRDLKPLNVMVGSFGEVQVMDWGLAKVVRGGAVRTVRSGRPEAESQAGSVLGTPAYMAPEQACGDTEGLDARCDVFGLGALLCEILTGSPPYRGRETGELLRKAARADLADAFARLDGCGADGELVRLAKACLAAEAAERPSDAGAVAEAVTAHLAGVQERLRKAELAKAAAQAKAVEERKRRRMTLALAATVLAAVVGAGAAALWYQAEHARRAAATERDVTAALDEATTLGKQAATLRDDPAKWEAALMEALSAVKRAEGVLNGGEGTEELRGRVAAVRAELEAADKDRLMIARLEKARLQEAAAGKQGFDHAGAASLYAAAFEDDMGLSALTADEAADWINRRVIREELLAALDDWARLAPNENDRERLSHIVQAADPDPASLRNRCTALLARRDWDGLRRLVSGPEAGALAPASLVSLARQVREADGAAEAVRFLKEADERRPGDFWILFELAYACQETKPATADAAIRYYTAALALRPRSAAAHNNLGAALGAKGQADDEIAEYRKAAELQPDFALAHRNLGVCLSKRRQPDEAIAEFRKAVEDQPDYADAHAALASALRDKDQLDEAIAEYRKAAELQPGNADAHNNLGIALRKRGRPDEAVAAFRKVVELKPGDADAHDDLGRALDANRQLDDAIEEYKKALELKPGWAVVHNNIGVALQSKRQWDDAIDEYHKALDLQRDFPLARNNLCLALKASGRLQEAMDEYDIALHLKPDDADARNNLDDAQRQMNELMKAVQESQVDLDVALRRCAPAAQAYNNLGVALSAMHRLDAAEAEFRKAVELQPESAAAHFNLANTLHDQGRLDEAIAEYRRAVEQKPDDAAAHFGLGVALRDRDRPDEAIAEYRKAIDRQPDYADAHAGLGDALYARREWDAAIAEYRKAVELKPDDALAHNNLSNALRDKGRLDEAVAQGRKAVEQQPESVTAHAQLGDALYARRNWDEAIAEYRRADDLQPGNYWDLCSLGAALYAKGRLDEAIAVYRKALDLGLRDIRGAHYSLGFALRDKRQLDEAVAEFRKAVTLTPKFADAHANLGRTLYALGRLDEAVAEFRKAVELQPDSAPAYYSLGGALRKEGRFAESVAVLRRWQELESRDPQKRYSSAEQVRQAEELVRSDALLPVILKGAAAPASPAAALRFARVCYYKRRNGDSARFYAAAFAAEPQTAEGLGGSRYDAACSAALAGGGQGEEAAKTDDKERTRWRQQARDWLRADLALWTKKIAGGNTEDRAATTKALQHWQEDPDLPGVRDKDALAKLPADEQDAWRQLWGDVDALVKKAQGK